MKQQLLLRLFRHPTAFAVAFASLTLTACVSNSVPKTVTARATKPVTQECKVCARTLWNDTGIDLKQGVAYRFEVNGEWKDWYMLCDENGPRSPLLRVLTLPLRPGLRLSPLRNWQANFCSLVGMIGAQDETRIRRDAFLIGDGMVMCAPYSGRLHTFANDWKSAYGNNKGHLTLTVIEVGQADDTYLFSAKAAPSP